MHRRRGAGQGRQACVPEFRALSCELHTRIRAATRALAPPRCHPNKQVRFVLGILEQHPSLPLVVVSDTDTVWLRQPWPYFEQRPATEFFISTDCLSHEVGRRGRQGMQRAPASSLDVCCCSVPCRAVPCRAVLLQCRAVLLPAHLHVPRLLVNNPFRPVNNSCLSSWRTGGSRTRCHAADTSLAMREPPLLGAPLRAGRQPPHDAASLLSRAGVL